MSRLHSKDRRTRLIVVEVEFNSPHDI